MIDVEKNIKDLIEKATQTEDCDQAMRFSQAALNAAHAVQVLSIINPHIKPD